MNPRSLAAFPLATSVVATVTRAARTIGSADGESIMVSLLAAVAVGGCFMAVFCLDTRTRPQTVRGWITATLVAVINSFLLFVAARGIDKF